MNPWFITGFSDAEGSFTISIIKDTNRKMGFVITYSFIIGLNIRDKIILENIKSYFGVGEIYNHPSDNTCRYKVSNLNDILNVIIPHFNTYPLITQKYIDFQIFNKILQMIKEKKHLTPEGLNNIVNLRTNLNIGFLDKNKIKNNFTIEESIRLIHSINGIPNSYWLLGFIQGEACFYISIYKSPKSKLGEAIQLVFKITQHTRDTQLMKHILNFLNLGRVEKRLTDGCDYTVTSSFEELFTKLNFNLLLGLKLLDFKNFYQAYKLKKEKKHLTVEGLDIIKKLKKTMSERRANKE